MTPRLPETRLIRPALTLHLHLQIPPQTRTLFGIGRAKDGEYIDPFTADFLKKKPTSSAPFLPPPRGDLAPSSIFESQDGTSRPTHSTTQNEQSRKRDPMTMAAALDPQPLVRARWQRKMLIRDITHRHRPSKTTLLLRTERSSRSKSPFFKTSIKKLGPIARQIAGKPLEDAMVQMRFSKKLVAKDVLKHLQYAKNEAIVRRGMGLGDEEEDGKGILVEDKNGKRRCVKDKTQMYVDQAWVGRGQYGTALDHRARGRVNVMRLPYTSITIQLKEEATRLRLMKEREEKRLRKKVWVQLPNRPITAQRQYCLW